MLLLRQPKRLFKAGSVHLCLLERESCSSCSNSYETTRWEALQWPEPRVRVQMGLGGLLCSEQYHELTIQLPQDELAEIVSIEQGKTLADAKGDVFRGQGDS